MIMYCNIANYDKVGHDSANFDKIGRSKVDSLKYMANSKQTEKIMKVEHV